MINEQYEWQEFWLNDINFYFRIKNSNSVVVDFEAYETRIYDDGNGAPNKLICFNEQGSEEYTHDVSKADIYVNGFIKWDGCSEVDFARNIHSCGGRTDLVRLGKLFEEVFSVASGMIDSSAEYL
jgi:hypothetical protein